MRKKNGFVLRPIGEEAVVVPIGRQVLDCNALITLNQTGRYLWELLATDTNEELLIAALIEEYDVDAERASRDVSAFLSKLIAHGLVEQRVF